MDVDVTKFQYRYRRYIIPFLPLFYLTIAQRHGKIKYKMLLLSAQKSEADYDGTWCERVDPAAHLRIDHLRELSLNLASCINQC